MTTPLAPILEVRGASKSYGAVQALHDVSFQLHAGEVIGLVGDNGAGKSTLFSLISGSQTPTEGGIYIDGARHHFSTPNDARAETLSMQLL